MTSAVRRREDNWQPFLTYMLWSSSNPVVLGSEPNLIGDLLLSNDAQTIPDADRSSYILEHLANLPLNYSVELFPGTKTRALSDFILKTVFAGGFAPSRRAALTCYDCFGTPAQERQKAVSTAREIISQWSQSEDANLSNIRANLALYLAEFATQAWPELLDELDRQEISAESTAALLNAIAAASQQVGIQARAAQFFAELLNSDRAARRYIAALVLDQFHDEISLDALRHRRELEHNEAVKAAIEAALRQ
jgi:hypothetical protein